ncbi:MAG: hypothetical protein GWN58_48335, partial [Anaerolineae bacterium]|nr:hypothetical protein [Anaerolineae bacterium]
MAASSNSTASGVGEVTIDITGVGAAISSDSTANGSGTRLLPVLGIYGTLNGFAHSATVEGEPLFTTDCQISESERNRVASISFIVEEDANSSTAYDAIEIGASVEIAHEMSGDAEDFPFRASTTRESSDTSQTTDTSTLPQPIVQRTTGVVVGVETVHVGAGGKAKL